MSAAVAALLSALGSPLEIRWSRATASSAKSVSSDQQYSGDDADSEMSHPAPLEESRNVSQSSGQGQKTFPCEAAG
ncbi:MAG: hypothetical protein ACYDGY_06805 [Acidimicrobiales bacterium]